MRKSIIVFLVLLSIFNYAAKCEDEQVQTYEIYDKNNDYPRPLLLKGNSDVIAMSGYNNGYMQIYNTYVELIQEKIPIFSYDASANLIQFGENKYMLVTNDYGQPIRVVVFDKSGKHTSRTFHDYKSDTWIINLTPLINNQLLLAYAYQSHRNIYLKVFDVSDSGDLTETNIKVYWGTDNKYISCIQMASNNDILCGFASNGCIEYIRIMENTDLTKEKTTTIFNNNGCAYEKVISIGGEDFAYCLLNNAIFRCYVGRHSENDKDSHQVIPMTEIMNGCKISAQQVDVAYFKDDRFIGVCVKESSAKIQVAVVKVLSNGFSPRIFECSGNTASHPFISRFGQNFISIFYHIGGGGADGHNVFEIIDVPNCINFNREVYMKQSIEFTLKDKVIKGSGVTEEITVTIIEVPKSGTVVKTGTTEPLSGTSVAPFKSYDKDNSYTYSADKTPGKYIFKFAGLTAAGDSGKRCSLEINVLPCYLSCDTCISYGTYGDHQCIGCLQDETVTYYPVESHPGNCEKDRPEYHYFNKTNKSWRKCYDTCDTCEDEGTADLNRCTKCLGPKNFPIENDKNGTCRDTTPEFYYFDTADNIYRKCYETCKTCSTKGTLENQNCIECKEGFYKFEDDTTGRCGDKTKDYDGYFKDDTAQLFKKCYSDCSSCDGKPTYKADGQLDKMNCKTCKNQYTMFEDKEGECSNIVPSGYYNDTTSDKLKKCYISCEKCSGAGDSTDNNCSTCASGYFLVSDQKGMCVNTQPPNHYKDTSNPSNTIFRPCYETCETCSTGGDSTNNNCDTCKAGYYPIEGVSKSCSKKPGSNYYLDETDSTNKVYKKCYSSCAECTQGPSADKTIHNCDKCKETYHFIDNGQTKKTNCLNQAPNKYYYDTDKDLIKKCLESCALCVNATGCTQCDNDNEYYLIEDTNGECTKTAPDHYYFEDKKFKKCYESCNTCSAKGTESNNNCDSCLNEKGYTTWISASTKKCVNTIPDGYFNDTKNNVISKCHQNCLHCDELGTGDNHKCTECATGFLFVNSNQYTGRCERTPPNGFYEDKDTNKHEKCNEACETCTNKKTSTSTNCIKCAKDYYFELNGAEGNCKKLPDEGYFLDDKTTDPKGPLITPCDQTCKHCTGKENDKCTECVDGYHFAEQFPGQCLNTKPPYHYQDPGTKDYKLCYMTCKTCSQGPTDASQNCDECKDDYLKVNNDCNSNCNPKFLYAGSGCVNECPNTHVKDNTKFVCVNCADKGLYKYEDGDQCVQKDKNSYIVEDKKDFNIIKKCGQSCATCSQGADGAGHDNCESCDTGKFIFETNCYEKCPTKYYYEGTCKDCPENLYADDNKKECVNCAKLTPPQYKPPNEGGTSKQCVSDIPPGYYVKEEETNYLEKCYDNCKTCTEKSTDENNMKCTSCKDNFSLLDGNCLSGCPTGLVNENGQCVNCKLKTPQEYNKDGVCVKVKDPNYFVEDDQFNKITQCDSDCAECVEKGSCTKCQNGYLDPELQSNNCVSKCDSKYSQNEADKVCINCQATGQYKYLDQNECISSKPSDSYVKDPTYNIIENCYESCAQCSQAGDSENHNCIRCKADYFAPDEKPTNCVNGCGDNYAISEVNQACINCKKEGEKFHIQGSKKCEDTTTKPEDYYIVDPNTNTIKKCKEGCSSCQDESVCNSCTTGYFLEYKGNNCLSGGCGENLVSDQTTNKCKNCADEQDYKFLADNQCIKKPPNTYLIENRYNTIGKCSNLCEECKGKATDASTNCEKCISGYYKEYGTDNCVSSCDKKYFSDNIERKCVNCHEKQEYKFLDVNECRTKPDNTYVKEEDFGIIEKCYKTCKTCSKGYEETNDNGVMKPNHNCDSCVEHYYMDFDTKNCILECDKTKYETDKVNGRCQKCVSPKVKYADSTECIEQPPGTKIVDENYRIIVDCYKTCNTCNEVGNDNTHLCQTCKPGLFSVKDSSKTSYNCVDDCSNVYYKDEANHQCINCKDNNGYKFLNENKCYPESEKPQGTLVTDKDFNIIDTCYKTCSQCSTPGSIEKNNCNECLDGYYFDPIETSNCISICPEKYGIDVTGKKCINCKGANQFKMNDERECKSTVPENTYFVDRDFNQKAYCYESCKKCQKGGTDIYNNCEECAAGYKSHPTRQGECLKDCPKAWYINDKNEYICVDDCSTIGNKPYLVEGSNQCVESCDEQTSCIDCKTDTYYQYENQCVKKCPIELNYGENPTTHKCELLETSECKIKQEDYLMIKSADDISKYLPEIVEKYHKSSTINYVGVVNSANEATLRFQLFRSDTCHYKSSIELGMSYVNFTECQEAIAKENQLKKYTDIIIAKVEVSRPNSPTIQIEYTAYNLYTGKEVSMKPCNNATVEYPLLVPDDVISKAKKAALSGYDIFDPDDKFYNDFCTPFYDENGDVIVKDRRKEFFDNITLCESGCNYVSIDFKTTRVKCNCNVKQTMISGVDEVVDNLPSSDFAKGLSKSNIIVVRCYNLVFNGKYFLKNAGSWLVLVFFLIQVSVLINFCFVKLKPLYAYLNKFPQEHPPKRRDLDDVEESESSEQSEQSHNKNRVEATPEHLLRMKTNQLAMLDLNRANQKGQNNNFIPVGSTSSRNIETNMMLTGSNVESSKGFQSDKEFRRPKLSFEDNELDALEFENAILYDKRGFCRIFCHIIRIKVLLINIFGNMTVLEPFFIGIMETLLTFSLFIVFNGLFYDDNILSLRRTSGDSSIKFFFKHEFPRAIYASLICTIICFILNFLTSSRKKFEELIRKEKDPDNYLLKSKKLVRCLKWKIAFFITLDVILMFASWYYVSAFCAVYQKTQGDLIAMSFATLVMCMIFQVVISLFIFLFRYIGLRLRVKCLFNFARYLM